MLKKILLVIIIGVLLVSIFVLFNMSFNNNSIISIKNDTENNISGLNIKIDSNPDIYIEIPEIKQKQTYQTELKLPEEFTEGSLKIIYRDFYEIDHEIYLEGYIEKGYKAVIIANINSVDDKGILSTDVSIQK